tara:strand:- start:90 stop:752 length:663 start_codon:yes stop_codon:yes gene_type:complete
MIQDRKQKTYQVMEKEAGLAGKNVLEIGCGNGRLTAMYAASAATVIGLEPGGSSIRQAATNVPNVSFLCGTGLELPFNDNVFDIALFSLSLHHHPDYQRALDEAARVVQKDGLVLVLEPTVLSQIQRLCKVFEDEDSRLCGVRDVLPQCGLEIVSESLFDTCWEFDDFDDVKRYAFSYYNHPPDTSKEQELALFLGSRKHQAPLLLSDTLCLTTLRAQAS